MPRSTKTSKRKKVTFKQKRAEGLAILRESNLLTEENKAFVTQYPQFSKGIAIALVGLITADRDTKDNRAYILENHKDAEKFGKGLFYLVKAKLNTTPFFVCLAEDPGDYLKRAEAIRYLVEANLDIEHGLQLIDKFPKNPGKMVRALHYLTKANLKSEEDFAFITQHGEDHCAVWAWWLFILTELGIDVAKNRETLTSAQLPIDIKNKTIYELIKPTHSEELKTLLRDNVKFRENIDRAMLALIRAGLYSDKNAILVVENAQFALEISYVLNDLISAGQNTQANFQLLMKYASYATHFSMCLNRLRPPNPKKRKKSHLNFVDNPDFFTETTSFQGPFAWPVPDFTQKDFLYIVNFRDYFKELDEQDPNHNYFINQEGDLSFAAFKEKIDKNIREQKLAFCMAGEKRLGARSPAMRFFKSPIAHPHVLGPEIFKFLPNSKLIK